MRTNLEVNEHKNGTARACAGKLHSTLLVASDTAGRKRDRSRQGSQRRKRHSLEQPQRVSSQRPANDEAWRWLATLT